MSISADGSVVTYHVGKPVTRVFVLQAMRSCGLDESLMPANRSPHECLKSALTLIYSKRGRLVRPSSKRNRFFVVDEVKMAAHNRYSTAITATYTKNDTSWGIELLDGAGSVLPNDQVMSEYRRQESLVTPAMMGNLIVTIINSLGGIRNLRKSGGVYWVPNSRMTEMAEIADVFNALPEVLIVPHVVEIDGRAIKGLVKSLSMEAESVRDTILTQMGDSGVWEDSYDRALEGIRARAADYREMIGSAMGEVEQVLDGCAEAAAAGLLASITEFDA